MADEYVHTHSRKVAEVMTQPPITITEETSLDEIVHLMEPLPHDRFGAGPHDAGSQQSTDQRMRTTGGNTDPPCDQVPGNRAHERAKNHPRIDDVSGHNAGANGLRHVHTEKQERYEVEERCPYHRIARSQHARRHDGCNRVRAVMQAVKKSNASATAIRPIKTGRLRMTAIAECVGYRLSMTSAFISFATSSKRSTTFSR